MSLGTRLIREYLVANTGQSPYFILPSSPGSFVNILEPHLGGSAGTNKPNIGLFPAIQGNYFQANDCVHIIGYGLYLPYNFQLADLVQTGQQEPSGYLYGQSVPALYLAPMNLNTGGFVQIMDLYGFPIMRENVYYQCDLFINRQVLGNIGGPFFIQATMNIANQPGNNAIVGAIDTFNCPAALANATYQARPFIEVEHSFSTGAIS